MNKTLNFYDKNAKKYADETLSVEFKDNQDRFLKHLKNGSYILDFGCGSGRDTRYFIDQGFNVEALDGSKSMCAIASKLCGIDVKHMLFQDFNEINKYDGIWACASLLHLKKDEVKIVIKNMIGSLKDNGIMYISFKYGEFEGYIGERYFTYYNDNSLNELLNNYENIRIIEQWLSDDVRKESSDIKWINVILKKI